MTQRLDARAEAIRAVLEPFDFNQTTLPFPASPVNLTGAAPKAVISKFAATGLRAAILEVLKEHGPMRAPQIARILEQTGFKSDSKTPLSTRIYNDCWRMIELDLVENDGGLFKPKKAA
jgi:hypothetical protein